MGQACVLRTKRAIFGAQCYLWPEMPIARPDYELKKTIKIK
ncbi:MAG: hypothetical protein [Olavius algarvensis Delta 4 endosymbiont]|nr:MAG: hypothetical protein [Olavius algarvensis Delta 4 endosymbiont]